MTTPPYGLEVVLDQRFRLARGQEARLAGNDLRLRKVAFTRREPPPGFEDRGDELRLTLEIRLGGEPRRKTLSWWDNDEQDSVLVFWTLDDLEVHAERSGMLRVVSVARRGTPPDPPSEPAPSMVPRHAERLPDPRVSDPPSRGEHESSQPGEAPAQVRVRRRRKRRRRSWLRRALDSMLGRNAASSRTSPVSPPASDRKHGRRRSRTRSRSQPERQLPTSKLRFEQQVGWLWSLRILRGEQTLGVMRGANPLALVATVEDYIVAFGSPRPGYSIVLRSGRSGRQLVLDGGLVKDLRTERAASILSDLDSHYRRRTPHESHSMTVMTDEHGQVVNTDALLTHAFDPCGDG